VSLRKFIGGWYHVCNNVAVRILEFSNWVKCRRICV
jgi:hypothetical protein